MLFTPFYNVFSGPGYSHPPQYLSRTLSGPVNFTAPCYPQPSSQPYSYYGQFSSYATNSRLTPYPSANPSARPPSMGAVDPIPLYPSVGVPSELCRPSSGPAPLMSHTPPNTAPPLQHHQQLQRQLSQMSNGQPEYKPVIPPPLQTPKSEISTPSSVGTPPSSLQSSMYAAGDSNITLWQFLLELLRTENHSTLIQWTNNEGEFKVCWRTPHNCVGGIVVERWPNVMEV